MDPDPETDYAAMTWEQAETAIPAADFVVLPTGSTEQHSLHLPLGTDAFVADYLAHRYAARAREYGLSMRVLPTMPYGYSEHHHNFAGTITLTPSTFADVVVEVAASVTAHGANRLLLVNAHGGNDEPLKLATDRIQREFDLPVHTAPREDAIERLGERFGDDWGHAGPYETSVMEHLHPALVREERIRPQTRHEIEDTRQYAYFDEFTEEGGRGDPTDADPEFVMEVIEEGIEQSLEVLAADVERSG